MVILILVVLLVLFRKRRAKLKIDLDLQRNPMEAGNSRCSPPQYRSYHQSRPKIQAYQARPVTTVCGLIGIGFPATLLKPAS